MTHSDPKGALPRVYLLASTEQSVGLERNGPGPRPHQDPPGITVSPSVVSLNLLSRNYEKQLYLFKVLLHISRKMFKDYKGPVL